MRRVMGGLRFKAALLLLPVVLAMSCVKLEEKPADGAKAGEEYSRERLVAYVEVPRELSCQEKFELSYVGGQSETLSCSAQVSRMIAYFQLLIYRSW